MFSGRKLLIVTKHGKERVIAQTMESQLGVICAHTENIDTDQFGTFTGETERTLAPLSAAKQKCIAGMTLNHSDLAVASEGSFFPHPNIPFVPLHEEVLIFIDTTNNIEISIKQHSFETNFSSAVVTSEKELVDFAHQSKFPSHKLILRKTKDDFDEISKGIGDWQTLLTTFSMLLKNHTSVYVETDMRAMNNPTRMSVIQSATRKLVDKINSLCPSCNTPGFGVSDIQAGLPCNLCGAPTKSILSEIHQCLACAYQFEKLYPNQKTSEDPMHCDFCNP